MKNNVHMLTFKIVLYSRYLTFVDSPTLAHVIVLMQVTITGHQHVFLILPNLHFSADFFCIFVPNENIQYFTVLNL